MKLLRRTVRKLLVTEMACAGATAKIQQGLDEIEKRDLVIEVEFVELGGYDVFIREAESLMTVGMFEVSASRVCPVYITAWTEVNGYLAGTGIGAVMYDVAIEVATKLGNYLACDRGTVSSDAKPMWRYYNASDDYESFQMDTRNGYFTPGDPEDDCKQMIFHRDTKISKGDDPSTYKEEFMASPFTKAFKKKRITTIPCLGDRYIEVH